MSDTTHNFPDIVDPHVIDLLFVKNREIRNLKKKVIKGYNKILDIEYSIRNNLMFNSIVKRLEAFINNSDNAGLTIFALKSSTNFSEHELWFILYKMYNVNKFNYLDVVLFFSIYGIIVEHKPPYTFIFKRNL